MTIPPAISLDLLLNRPETTTRVFLEMKAFKATAKVVESLPFNGEEPAVEIPDLVEGQVVAIGAEGPILPQLPEAEDVVNKLVFNCSCISV